MQVIIKEREDGKKCLFDTRSSQFLEGCCVSFEDYSDNSLVSVANTVVKRPFKHIVEIAESQIYGEFGYLESMLASKYLSLNPDIKQKVIESNEKIKTKTDKKMTYTGKKRGRKPKEDKVEKPKVLDANGQPRKRGRPKKIV